VQFDFNAVQEILEIILRALRRHSRAVGPGHIFLHFRENVNASIQHWLAEFSALASIGGNG
jgi:hypothetical protein